MISSNGGEADSAVTLNVKRQAIAAVHSHRCIDANNNSQRLNFTMGDFALLFQNQSIAIDEQDGGGGATCIFDTASCIEVNFKCQCIVGCLLSRQVYTVVLCLLQLLLLSLFW